MVSLLKIRMAIILRVSKNEPQINIQSNVYSKYISFRDTNLNKKIFYQTFFIPFVTFDHLLNQFFF